jgi:hypothetical protein
VPVPVDIDLGHQSDEYSSAIDPVLALNLFQAALVASTTLAILRFSRLSRSTNSVSDASTISERLSVRFSSSHQVFVQREIDWTLAAGS